MKSNLLVTLADTNYLDMAKQVFSSAYFNSGWKGDYMLLAHNVPEKHLTWFKDKGILIKKCIPLDYKSIDYFFNPVVLDKFYLFTEEFKKWDRIVFLDSDVIVRRSLKHLTKTKYFAAARDLFFNDLSSHFTDPNAFEYYNNYQYDLKSASFNSGVFAFNTDIIDENTFTDLFNLFYSNNDAFKYLDQATLNLYFYKKWEKLPAVFNVFMCGFKTNLPWGIKPIINHFITCPDYTKLWDPSNPYYDEWKYYLNKAEEIDLDKQLKGVQMGILRIRINSFLLKFHILYYARTQLLRGHTKKIYRKLQTKTVCIINTPNMLMGKTGEFIHNRNPLLYNKLKSIISKNHPESNEQ